MKDILAVPLPLASADSCAPGTRCQRFFLDVLRQFQVGKLELTMPDGQRHVYGDAGWSGPVARMAIFQHRFFRRVILHGEIGFGEAYVDGDWESDDPAAVVAFFIRNVEHNPSLSGSRVKVWWFNTFRALARFGHWARRNTPANSRKNIHEHYDLSNAFYGQWLDATWTYSSAYFTPGARGLEAAQEEKYRRLCERLQFQPGQHVLEIGCGWGGFALFAAQHYGVKVTGLTISEEQLKKGRERVAQAGLSDQIDLKFCDYREHQGQYDAIVSIEMLEAVGHQFLPQFTAQIERLLKRDGVVGIQVITSPDGRYRQGRKSADWIKKHIFPGGQLPSVSALNQAFIKTGELYLQHLESFGLHYSQTLRLWRERFEARWDAIAPLGFDEDFRRKWRYYLAYCEAAFAQRNINVVHLTYARPNNQTFALAGEKMSLPARERI